MRLGLHSILGELRERFEGLYGERLARLVLFGSQARGDAESGSDVDLLVILKGPVSACQEIARTSEIVSDLSLAHAVAIACVFMDEDRFLHRQGPLLRNVRREGVPV